MKDVKGKSVIKIKAKTETLESITICPHCGLPITKWKSSRNKIGSDEKVKKGVDWKIIEDRAIHSGDKELLKHVHYIMGELPNNNKL